MPVTIPEKTVSKAPASELAIPNTKGSRLERIAVEKPSEEDPKPSSKDLSADVPDSMEARAAIRRAKRFAKSLLKKPDSDALESNPRASHSLNASQSKRPLSQPDEEDESEASDSSSEEVESLDTNLIHETLLSKKPLDSTARLHKPRINIPNETPEERNSRTIFVGNVNVECVKNKVRSTISDFFLPSSALLLTNFINSYWIQALTREFLDHLLNPLSESEPLASRSRIESHRFRGLPLATPIVTAEKTENRSDKRSRKWRETQSQTEAGTSEKAFIDNPDGGRAGLRGAKTLPEAATAKLPEVKFLTPSQKRKVGYVTGDLHPDAKCCVAFVLISPPAESSESQEDGVSLSAHELAKKISEKSDGTSFMGHVLRCDLAGTKYPGQSTQAESQIISPDEQRRTLFVGGLDFAEQEDSVRKAIEARLEKEMDGSPPDGGTWVQRVRIVRDKGTALGKGFAYVLLLVSILYSTNRK